MSRGIRTRVSPEHNELLRTVCPECHTASIVFISKELLLTWSRDSDGGYPTGEYCKTCEHMMIMSAKPLTALKVWAERPYSEYHHAELEIGSQTPIAKHIRSCYPFEFVAHSSGKCQKCFRIHSKRVSGSKRDSIEKSANSNERCRGCGEIVHCSKTFALFVTEEKRQSHV